MDAAASFVGLVGPAIERGDSTVLKRIVPYVDQYLLQGDCTRAVLVRRCETPTLIVNWLKPALN
jgi:hypothetical protein